MQKDILKKTKNSLIILIIASIIAVASIPGIALGAVNNIWWIMIPCIVFVGSGFYGLPIGWVFFGILKESKNYYLAITEDEIWNVEELARNYGKSEKYVINKITSLLGKRYLFGFKFNDTKTELIRVEKKEKNIKKNLCPYCGVSISKDDIQCKYCGGHL